MSSPQDVKQVQDGTFVWANGVKDAPSSRGPSRDTSVAQTTKFLR